MDIKKLLAKHGEIFVYETKTTYEIALPHGAKGRLLVDVWDAVGRVQVVWKIGHRSFWCVPVLLTETAEIEKGIARAMEELF